MSFRIRFFAGTSPAVRRGLKSVAWAMFLSLGAVLLCYAAVWKFYPEAATFSPNRVSAFVDSLLAGVVGFALLGAFAYLGSLRKPDEDAISDRIAYLYSARLEENDSTREFLTEELMRLGAVIRSAESRYSFVEFDVPNNVVRVNVLISMTIVNMMRWDDYHQRMPVRVMFDSVSGHSDHIGNLIRVETVSCDSSGHYGPKKSHLPHPVPLVGDQRHEGSVELEIPPHGELRYEYEYEGWVNTDDNFWTSANRFAERFTIVVTNLVSQVLSIEPHPDPKRPAFVNIIGNHPLNSGESTEIFVIENLRPSVPVTFRAKF
ncbi:hypothetical protein [Luteibacter sp. RCC_6_2]|uniref:hypothetical protein n=1 Tax=Luteibacter sp. RCC_6_2 TaxID=3239223 RepID=UPI0035244A09